MGQGAILFWKIELEITTKDSEFEEASKMCPRHLVLDMLRIRVQGWDKPSAQCRTADKTYRRKHSQFHG